MLHRDSVLDTIPPRSLHAPLNGLGIRAVSLHYLQGLSLRSSSRVLLFTKSDTPLKEAEVSLLHALLL